MRRPGLDRPQALPRQAEAAADLLERLRLGVDEPVAQDDHLPLAPRQRAERLLQRLAAQRDLDLLVGGRSVAGNEGAEHRVVLVADRLVERRRRTAPGLDLLRLL